MNDKREWQEFRTGMDRCGQSFLGAGDEILLRDTPEMGKWQGKHGVVVKVNPKTISLNIEGRGIKIRPFHIAKFRRGTADSIRKALDTSNPVPKDTGSAICPGARVMETECAVGDVVLMDRGGLFNIIRITRFGAKGGRVAGLVIGGNSTMVGKVRLFEPVWYVQKLDQARFPKQ